MASVTINGHTYTDDANTNTGLAGGGHKLRFIPALQDVVAVAAEVASDAIAAAASAADSNADASAAAVSAADALASKNTAETYAGAIINQVTAGAVAGSVVATSNGTVSAPIITRSTDLNTGIYFPTLDEIAMTCGGTLRQRLYASGMYVAGSTSSNLYLDASDHSKQRLFSTAVNGFPRWLAGTYTTSNETGSGNTGSNFEFIRRTDAGAALGTVMTMFRSNGNVVVGNTATDSASGLLQIALPAGGGTRLNAINAGMTNFASSLNNQVSLNIGAIDAVTGVKITALRNIAGQSTMTFETELAAAYVERMRITGTGNVLIGTTTESGSQKLTIIDATTNPGIVVGESQSGGVYGLMQWNIASNYLRLTTGSNTYPLVLQDVGARVLVGTTTENTSGAKLQVVDGITFPATQVASADANTLDDYEEGTFTPVVYGATTAGVGTYTYQNGKYTKIGNTVFIRLKLVWTAHTGTGNMRISGLPFTSNDPGIPSAYTPLSVVFDGLVPGANKILTPEIPSLSALIALAISDTSGGTLTEMGMDASVNHLAIAGTYFV